MLNIFSHTKKWFFLCLLAALPTSACGGSSPQTETPNNEYGNAAASTPLCVMVENDEKSNVVFSKENDWFLTVSKDSAVNCDPQQGYAAIDMAGIHINVVSQPLSGEGTLEQDIQAVITGYIQGFEKNITFDTPLAFTQKAIGEHGRRSYFSDASFELDGKRFHLLTSITAVETRNNAGIFHVVFWRVEENDYEQNKQVALEAVETISYSWFRLSDTDDEGNFITKW
ncbi:MAG: hypothetical protein JXX29_22175 [Deltaproteobacteria bacterium]|nr:hypothetical protein [Deltaproteobacteria bacterium]MBN2674404.1 hypothetical protein [Deltaproteobacteria bacterium]